MYPPDRGDAWHECTILSSQTTIVSRAEVDKAHNDLLQSVEDFLQELKSRQEQQRVEEEEAAKIKKLKEQQVRERGRKTTLLKMCCYYSTTMCYYWDMSVK